MEKNKKKKKEKRSILGSILMLFWLYTNGKILVTAPLMELKIISGIVIFLSIAIWISMKPRKEEDEKSPAKQ